MIKPLTSGELEQFRLDIAEKSDYEDIDVIDVRRLFATLDDTIDILKRLSEFVDTSEPALLDAFIFGENNRKPEDPDA